MGGGDVDAGAQIADLHFTLTPALRHEGAEDLTANDERVEARCGIGDIDQVLSLVDFDPDESCAVAVVQLHRMRDAGGACKQSHLNPSDA